MKKLLLALLISFAFVFNAVAAVNLNTATKAELETIKGIGPSKAQAIIDYRAKNGPFKSVDELDNVKGFGQKSVDKVRGELTVSGAASAKAAAPAKTAAPKPAAAQAAPAATPPR